MKKKQTAVEWLEEQFSLGKFFNWKINFEQAKNIEKKQIENSFDAGYFNYEVLFYDNAEEYYNETYGKDNE
jgi:hypothetical protein